MSTLNLSPKNPLLIVGLAVGAAWMLSRRATAASSYSAPRVGSGAVNGGVAQVLANIGALFSGVTMPRTLSGMDSNGNPIYNGSGETAGIGGTVPGWQVQLGSDAAAWHAAGYGDGGGSGDPLNPD